MADAGISARIEFAASLAALSEWILDGAAVVLFVNAGELLNESRAFDNGRDNYAVTVTQASIDPETARLIGVFIGEDKYGTIGLPDRFVDAAVLERAWLAAGGTAIVTDDLRLRKEAL